jgi:hypothetical protein
VQITYDAVTAHYSTRDTSIPQRNQGIQGNTDNQNPASQAYNSGDHIMSGLQTEMLVGTKSVDQSELLEGLPSRFSAASILRFTSAIRYHHRLAHTARLLRRRHHEAARPT